MSTAELETPVETPIYKAPQVRNWTEVVFYPDCDESQAGCIAWVVKTGEQAVELMVLGNTMRHMRYVRHISDERRLTQNFRHNGSWDFRPASPLVEELQARVGVLEKQIAELTDALTSGKKAK